jgi:4-hydroxythreonine-4-phosphate dehydrogenase
MKRIAVTSGDPAGIGPQIIGKALQFFKSNEDRVIVVYGKISGNLDYTEISEIDEAVYPHEIYLIKIDDSRVELGVESKLSGAVAYRILERCLEDLNSKKADAVVTCPVSKNAIRKTHPDFIGHTEFFAQNKHKVFMTFWGKHFNVGLLSTHISLKDVSKKMTEKKLLRDFEQLHEEISEYIDYPKLAVLGVNPHSGEHGAFGNEDEMIKQVLSELKKKDIYIAGPFPADTFFSKNLSEYNFVISAYHDQGLIPFKMMHQNEGVNVTLGLPFIRTSVDHGTAFDIAKDNVADEKSLEHGILLAENFLLKNYNKRSDIYDVFAEYYDDYMSHVNYDTWVNLILNLYTKRHNSNPKLTLEAACGTCNISTRLVKKGLKTEACDISREMLKVANRKENRPFLFRRGMLEQLPANRYNLILLMFDSINYLTEKEEISKLLNIIYKSLKKDGMFIFDISTITNCEENFDGLLDIDDSDGEYMIHNSELDYFNYIQTTKLTFFKKTGFVYKRFDETHKQRIYFVAELKKLISESKLNLSGIYSTESDRNLLNSEQDTDRNFTRLFFCLNK